MSGPSGRCARTASLLWHAQVTVSNCSVDTYGANHLRATRAYIQGVRHIKYYSVSAMLKWMVQSITHLVGAVRHQVESLGWRLAAHGTRTRCQQGHQHSLTGGALRRCVATHTNVQQGTIRYRQGMCRYMLQMHTLQAS